MVKGGLGSSIARILWDRDIVVFFGGSHGETSHTLLSDSCGGTALSYVDILACLHLSVPKTKHGV
jgi:hypothetical protein